MQQMTNVNDKDVDLGVETDFTNFRIQTKLLSACSGAGVNAESSVQLAFATADPLSELVWSPHSGLSLKCANRGEDVRKPFLLWNVGPSSTDPLLEQGGGGDDHDMIIDKELGPSHGDAYSDTKMEEEGEVEREADSCHPQTVQTDEWGKEVAEKSSAVVPAATLKKLESSAENDLHRLIEKEEFSLGGAELPAEGSCMGSRRRGKALSDGDVYGRSSDEEDDSTESSNSAGQTPRGMKGVKRKICDEGAILGSKKMKKQIHGSDGSTFVMKPDSSFMKWISSMTTKGHPDLNKENSLSPLHLACANDVFSKNFVCFKPQGPAAASISMGFQAVFQSLYCRETDESSVGGEKIVKSIEVSREGAVDDGKSPENLHEHTIPIIIGSPSADVDHLAKDTASDGAVRADALGEERKIAAKQAYPDMTVAPRKPRTSLWITRLATNTLRSEKGKETAEETIGCSTDLDSQANTVSPVIDSEASFEVKTVSKLRPLLPCERFSSDGMASAFARRLDALRHITSSKKGMHQTGWQACLFCGGCHDVGECPSVTKSDHRAVPCPGGGRLQLNAGREGDCSSRKAAVGSFPAYGTWKLNISLSERERNSALNATKDNQRCDIATVQNTAVMFDAIRNLRLSRADILRWMISGAPLSHLNGFFLRLRLGNKEAGLGGCSYYVACICITGDNTSTKCISVDVGGFKSSVATQYVSNNDFLEDEIKAWWSRSVGSGCRIPSLAELNSKFNDRHTFGF